MTLKDLNISKSWTLFVDRDGVINKNRVGDYVKNYDEFEFIAGVKEAFVELNNHFGRIIVVTNQQGIGKGLYTESDVEGIHLSMMLDIMLAGGHIDRIFFAPQLASENSEMRKPNIGMARLAKEEFPDIDFTKSLMIGDAISDMQFGRTAGMKTVFVGAASSPEEKKLIDFHSASLVTFAKEI